LIRRHFFLAAALLVLGLMVVAGALRLMAGHGQGPPGGAQAAAGRPGGASGPGGPDRGTVVTPAVVAERSFTDHIEVLGVAKGRQSVTITSNTTELVTGVHFKDGEAVRKGQVLVDLKATEQDAGVLQNQAALDLAKLDWDRWQSLADRGVAPRATADQYRIAYEQAKANLAAARSRRADRVIRAPFSGVVGLSDIAPGALINPGAPVATLDDIAVIRVDFDIPDRYLPELRQGLAITARADDYPNETFQGVIAQLDTRIDEKTRAIKARAEFPNTGGRLKPGMLMRVSIDQGQRTALAAPEAAVQFNADQAYVYVITRKGPGAVAVQRPVTPGADQGGFFEIKDGLSPGEVIVADGVNRVSPNQPVRVLEAAGRSAPSPAAAAPAPAAQASAGPAGAGAPS
jgi:membrane fusion protein (multidrug efflux system)